MIKFADNMDWERIENKMIEKYPSLTEEDFKFDNDDELIIHLAQKLGKSKEELREIFRNL